MSHALSGSASRETVSQRMQLALCTPRDNASTPLDGEDLVLPPASRSLRCSSSGDPRPPFSAAPLMTAPAKVGTGGSSCFCVIAVPKVGVDLVALLLLSAL